MQFQFGNIHPKSHHFRKDKTVSIGEPMSKKMLNKN